MGQTLSEPVTAKETTSCHNDQYKVGSSSMQGWRISILFDHNSQITSLNNYYFLKLYFLNFVNFNIFSSIFICVYFSMLWVGFNIQFPQNVTNYQDDSIH